MPTERVETLWPNLISADNATVLLELIGVEPTPDRLELLRGDVQKAFDNFFFDTYARYVSKSRSTRSLNKLAKLLPQLIHLMTGAPSEGWPAGRLRAVGLWRLLDHLHADYNEQEAWLSPPGTKNRSEEISGIIFELHRLDQAVRGALLAIDREPGVIDTLLQTAANADWEIRKGLRPQRPEFDIFVGTLGRIYKRISGKLPGTSERAAGPSAPRTVEGPFIRFVDQIATIGAGYVSHDGELRRDPDWVKFFQPTPDEIREAWRRFSKNYRLSGRLK